MQATSFLDTVWALNVSFFILFYFIYLFIFFYVGFERLQDAVDLSNS